MCLCAIQLLIYVMLNVDSVELISNWINWDINVMNKYCLFGIHGTISCLIVGDIFTTK